MGHMRVYSIGDLLARFMTMRGYAVLHPMGWDAFGMPAENAALDRGIHPDEWTRSNIANMKVQMKRLGVSYDWDREIATCDPSYYRWNQWIFLKMHERGSRLPAALTGELVRRAAKRSSPTSRLKGASAGGVPRKWCRRRSRAGSSASPTTPTIC